MRATVRVPPEKKLLLKIEIKSVPCIRMIYYHSIFFKEFVNFCFVLRSQPWKVNIRLGKSFVSSREISGETVRVVSVFFVFNNANCLVARNSKKLFLFKNLQGNLTFIGRVCDTI